MKTIFLFVFIIAVSSSFSQNFGISGTKWFYNRTDESIPPNSEYQLFQSIGDTVIEGRIMQKIFQTNFKTKNQVEQIAPIYIFESSDTVFLYDLPNNKYIKLYIFNASVSDTLTLDFLKPISANYDTTYKVIIDSIEQITIDGIAIKKYKSTILVDNPYYRSGSYFLDRIGWVNWFFPVYYSSIPTAGYIRCYSDNQIDTNFQAFDCDYKLAISKVDNPSIQVFPNPVSGTMFISAPEAFYFEIINSMGLSVMRGTSNEIDVSNLISGMYVVRIIMSNYNCSYKFTKE